MIHLYCTTSNQEFRCHATNLNSKSVESDWLTDINVIIPYWNFTNNQCIGCSSFWLFLIYMILWVGWPTEAMIYNANNICNLINWIKGMILHRCLFTETSSFFSNYLLTLLQNSSQIWLSFNPWLWTHSTVLFNKTKYVSRNNFSNRSKYIS